MGRLRAPHAVSWGYLTSPHLSSPLLSSPHLASPPTSPSLQPPTSRLPSPDLRQGEGEEPIAKARLILPEIDSGSIEMPLKRTAPPVEGEEPLPELTVTLAFEATAQPAEAEEGGAEGGGEEGSEADGADAPVEPNSVDADGANPLPTLTACQGMYLPAVSAGLLRLVEVAYTEEEIAQLVEEGQAAYEEAVALAAKDKKVNSSNDNSSNDTITAKDEKVLHAAPNALILLRPLLLLLLLLPTLLLLLLPTLLLLLLHPILPSPLLNPTAAPLPSAGAHPRRVRPRRRPAQQVLAGARPCRVGPSARAAVARRAAGAARAGGGRGAAAAAAHRMAARHLRRELRGTSASARLRGAGGGAGRASDPNNPRGDGGDRADRLPALRACRAPGDHRAAAARRRGGAAAGRPQEKEGQVSGEGGVQKHRSVRLVSAI